MDSTKKLLFNQWERRCIRTYDGKWGDEIPVNIKGIIIAYNLLKIAKSISKITQPTINIITKILR